MKKTALFVMILLFAVNGIFAWPNGNWVYAIPGLDAKMKFWVSGGIDLTSGEITIRQAGKYRVSGDRLTVTFGRISESVLKDLSGVTVVFSILNNGDIVDQSDGTIWVRIE